MRFRVHGFGHVWGDTLHPLRVNRPDGAGEDLRGLHQLRSHDPLRWFLGELRARVHHEVRIARPGELLGVALSHADIGEQAREHRFVHRLFLNVLLGKLQVAHVLQVRDSPGKILNHRQQLTHQIHPFSRAHVVDELALAQLVELISAELPPLFLQVVPQFQYADEIGVSRKPRVELIRLALVFQRTLAHILNAERGHNHRHLLQHIVVMCCLQHPG